MCFKNTVQTCFLDYITYLVFGSSLLSIPWHPGRAMIVLVL
jgi:hypothetical protein